MFEREFKINEREFKLLKINGLVQFHVARKISGILTEMMIIMQRSGKSKRKLEDFTEDEMLETLSEILVPFMNGLAKLSDRDSEFVLLTLCAHVEMKQDHGNWAKLANDGRLMFEDLDLMTLLQGAGRAFAYNLGGFFSANQRISTVRA